MVLQNTLGITDEAALARADEKYSKIKARLLFERGLLTAHPVGSFAALAAIHRFLFEDVYPFAGQVRRVNIAKGYFRFASVLYLEEALHRIERMPHSTFDEIVAKYVEMNVAHPFREGNGRSMRIWLNRLLQEGMGMVVDWSTIDRNAYLQAMERSPVNDAELKQLLRTALTPNVHDRMLYMKGIDASYHYEGYHSFCTADLSPEADTGVT